MIEMTVYSKHKPDDRYLSPARSITLNRMTSTLTPSTLAQSDGQLLFWTVQVVSRRSKRIMFSIAELLLLIIKALKCGIQT